MGLTVFFTILTISLLLDCNREANSDNAIKALFTSAVLTSILWGILIQMIIK